LPWQSSRWIDGSQSNQSGVNLTGTIIKSILRMLDINELDLQ